MADYDINADTPIALPDNAKVPFWDGSAFSCCTAISFRLKNRGAWADATAYVVNDIVSFQGSSYVCILATSEEEPTNATYWDILASVGQDGEDGMDGSSGLGYGGNSSTAITGVGEYEINLDSQRAYQIGARVRFTDSSTPANYIEGVVNTVITASTFNITFDRISGAFASGSSWSVNLAGDRGETGATGAVNYGASTDMAGVLYASAGMISSSSAMTIPSPGRLNIGASTYDGIVALFKNDSTPFAKIDAFTGDLIVYQSDGTTVGFKVDTNGALTAGEMHCPALIVAYGSAAQHVFGEDQLGLWGVSPSARPNVEPSTGATDTALETKFNELLTALNTTGIISNTTP